ncbi:MAG: helix-turn-helix transcriptional regulator [Lawsonibacter sp.]|jgi:transcriptional regulator with XRE-family HTH domain|nr:helix-turn-helix transcriptional regulator [Lawsonibacter sp.]
MIVQTNYPQKYIKFGLKVQYYRKLRGMTQEAFADKAGISWSYLAKIESPTRPFGVSMETLFKIADVLDVPVSKLFED